MRSTNLALWVEPPLVLDDEAQPHGVILELLALEGRGQRNLVRVGFAPVRGTERVIEHRYGTGAL